MEPEKITVPTLVVHGELDEYSSAGGQRALLSRLGARERAYATIPNSDHAAHLLRHREVLHRTVASFVACPRVEVRTAEASTPKPTPCELALALAAPKRQTSTAQLLDERSAESLGEGGSERHHRAIRSQFRKVVRAALLQSRFLAGSYSPASASSTVRYPKEF